MALSVSTKLSGTKRFATWSAETTAGNSGITAYAPEISCAVSSVQVTGTFGGATVTMLGSNNGTDWVALGNVQGAAISLTAAGGAEMSTGFSQVKPNIAGGTGDSLTISFVHWGA